MTGMNTSFVNQSIMDYVSVHPWIIVIIVWSVIWKLIALWKAARNNHMTVFIVLAFLNTAGIAEILYLTYVYYKGKKEQKISGQIN